MSEYMQTSTDGNTYVYEDMNDHKGWICPRCGRALAPDMKVCPYCGVSIAPTTEGLEPG